MSGTKAKTVAKYVILPGFIPRLKALFGSGFGYIAFLMAQIYAMVRLLPADHPYLNPQNVGRFGIRHVIAETANSITISKNNIDQLIVFVLMLTGVVLLGVQLLVLMFNLVIKPAIALPFAEGPSIFITPNPTFDIAYILMDQVFGIGPLTAGPPFFNSCVAQNVSCDPAGFIAATGPFPWPFHTALQSLFEFYSLGILVIGVIIFLYFVVVVVVETATTGTPFGQRFQNVWVPIRLVMAIGLLVPLNYGYNAGQYITFAAAKYGSGLATNGWIRYNNTIHGTIAGNGNPLGERENLIARPKPPDAAIIAEMMSIVHACAFAEYLYNPNITKYTNAGAGTIRMDHPEDAGWAGVLTNHQWNVRAYLVKSPPNWQAAVNATTRLWMNPAMTYDQALDFYTSGDIIIQFAKPTDSFDPANGITPVCGEIQIPISDRTPGGAAAWTAMGGDLGAVRTQAFFFELIRDLWSRFPDSETYHDFAGRMITQNDQKAGGFPCRIGCTNANLPNGGCGANPPPNADCARREIPATWRQATIDVLQTEINTALDTIWDDYNANVTRLDMDATIMQRGWGGAGMFFNRLAEVNGPFIAAWMDMPRMQSYPIIMEEVRKARTKTEIEDPPLKDMFNPNTSNA